MCESSDLEQAKPMSDEQLRKATIGEPLLLNDRVVLSPHDPQWKMMFDAEAIRIRGALGSRVLRLEHVGSTSVPGLSAKPVIDMVLAVPDSADETAYVPALEAIDYSLRIREPGRHEHRMLKPAGLSGNLHVFSSECEEINRMILFRDWLRDHPKDRILYENTKRELASRTWKYMQNYADAKSEVVREILHRANARGS